MARLVEQGLRAVAPDLIGFGRSDKPAGPTAYSVRAHVDWLAQFTGRSASTDGDPGGPGLGRAHRPGRPRRRPGLVRRVVAANTVLHTADAALAGRLAWPCHANPDGTVTVAQMLLDYQRLTQEVTPFRPSLFVQGATESESPTPSWRPTTHRSPTRPSRGAAPAPLLMGLTPRSECARLNRRTMRTLAARRRPFPHRVLRRRSRDARAGPRC